MSEKKTSIASFLVLAFLVMIMLVSFAVLLVTIYESTNSSTNNNSVTKTSPAAEAEKPADAVPPADDEFEKWRELCYHSDSEKIDYAAAVEMAKLAKTYNDWRVVRICGWDTELESLAVNNMAKLAITSRDMCETAVYARRLDKHELEASLIGKLSTLAKNTNMFSDWLELSIATGYSDKYLIMHLAALNSMAETATTANNWTWVFEQAPSDSVYRQTALQRLNQLNPSFDNWFDIARVSLMEDNQATFQLAFTKMVQTAEDYYDWRWICEWSTPGSETEKLALRKMAELINK